MAEKKTAGQVAEPTTPAPETSQDPPAAPVAPATVQKEIPLLTEKDIECRVQSVSRAKTGKVGAVLLLYKDARVDKAEQYARRKLDLCNERAGRQYGEDGYGDEYLVLLTADTVRELAFSEYTMIRSAEIMAEATAGGKVVEA